jgi:hypothetical protein
MADVDRIVSVGPAPERLAERRPPRKRRKPEVPDPESPPAPATAAEEPPEADRRRPDQKHLDISV